MTNAKFKQILRAFKGGHTPTALQVSHILVGGTKINYEAIITLKHDLVQRGYKLTSFTVDKPPSMTNDRPYGQEITRYRLHKFHRDDCWPCGIAKEEWHHCLQWRACCNGSWERGRLRCGLAEQEEAREFNSMNKFVLSIGI